MDSPLPSGITLASLTLKNQVQTCPHYLHEGSSQVGNGSRKIGTCLFPLCLTYSHTLKGGDSRPFPIGCRIALSTKLAR